VLTADNNSQKKTRNRRSVVDVLPVSEIAFHVAVYSALVSLVHVFVLLAFNKESIQIKHLSTSSMLGFVSAYAIKHILMVTDVNHIFLVVPVYAAAGLLLQHGVRSAFGCTSKSGRTQAFAANVARVVSAVAVMFTMIGYTEWNQQNSWASLNALVVLEFCFMFQEFLLGYRRFTAARTIYSIVYLILTGCKTAQAFHFKGHSTASSRAPPFALAYALFLVDTSDNLAALAGVFGGLGLAIAANTLLALQSIVNSAVMLIMSASIYQRHTTLFQYENDFKESTFLESFVAVLVMCSLVFLLAVDSYFVPFTRAKVYTSRTSSKVRVGGIAAVLK